MKKKGIWKHSKHCVKRDHTHIWWYYLNIKLQSKARSKLSLEKELKNGQSSFYEKDRNVSFSKGRGGAALHLTLLQIKDYRRRFLLRLLRLLVIESSQIWIYNRLPYTCKSFSWNQFLFLNDVGIVERKWFLIPIQSLSINLRSRETS